MATSSGVSTGSIVLLWPGGASFCVALFQTMSGVRLALLAISVALPRAAAGQAGPTLPVALDLRGVAVGSWSEYTVKVAQLPPFKQRFALVARDASTCTLEMSVQGGMMSPRGRVVLKVVLDPDLSKPDRLKKVVMQLGD